MEVPRDTLAQLLNRSRQLYTLPAVALEVLELTNDPQLDTTRLKDCIERDPALTSKVLRVVNSSLFGLSRRVSDLNQALALLGTKPLKMLVLGFGLPEPLFTDLAGDALNQYWKHTLTRAVAARELSERIWRLPGDDLFVAGLLKDLGRLALIQGLGRPYVEMLRKANWPREEVRALERRLIGFDHVQLTAGLLDQWGLPETLIAAVQTPDSRVQVEALPADAQPAGTILYLAEKLAELLADERTDALGDLLIVAGRDGRLSEKQLAAMTASLEETVLQLADVLSLDLPRGLAYGELLARAYMQLSMVASEAAGDLAQGEQAAAKLRDFADREEARGVSAAAANLHSNLPLRTATAQPQLAATRRVEAQRAGGAGAATTSLSAVRPAKKAVCASRKVAPSTTIHPGLRARILSAAARCRQLRQELSLLLVEIDSFEDLVFLHGVPSVERLRQDLLTACQQAGHEEQMPLELTDARFAVVLAGCDRPAAADAGHLLLRQARDEMGGGIATLSIGASTVAVPAKNFDSLDIVRSAERCLRAAQLSGGNGFKSIEAY